MIKLKERKLDNTDKWNLDLPDCFQSKIDLSDTSSFDFTFHNKNKSKDLKFSKIRKIVKNIKNNSKEIRRPISIDTRSNFSYSKYLSSPAVSSVENKLQKNNKIIFKEKACKHTKGKIKFHSQKKIPKIWLKNIEFKPGMSGVKNFKPLDTQNHHFSGKKKEERDYLNSNFLPSEEGGETGRLLLTNLNNNLRRKLAKDFNNSDKNQKLAFPQSETVVKCLKAHSKNIKFPMRKVRKMTMDDEEETPCFKLTNIMKPGH